MAINTQVLIENIRTAMAYSEQIPPDTLRQYATDYADQCKTLNDRFEQLLPFIKSDNVAEAVRHAEMPPNVVDLYTALDFDGRQDWADICDVFGFPVPIPLPQELFQQLQDAYNSYQPLEYLLQQNRILALNGSPVHDRLMVIRALAQNDVQNTFWAEDQEQFEKIRLGQLKTEIPQAIAAENDLQVQMMYQELATPGWRVEPPPRYLASLVEHILKGHAKTLDGQANAYDYEAARKTLQTMRQILQSHRLEMPPSVADFIAPALQWMAMEQQTREWADQYTDMENRLRYALDRDESWNELENLYYALHRTAVQTNRPIPPDLEQRYYERVNGLERKTTMKRRLILTAVVGACVLFAVLIGIGIQIRMHANEIAKVLIALQEIEEKKRLEDIEKTIQRLQTDKPAIAGSAEVAATIAKLQAMLDEDGRRAKDFDRYATQVEAALASKPEFHDLKPVAEAMEQAGKFVRTASEEERLANLQTQHKLQTAHRQREIDEHFGNALAELSRELNDVPRSQRDQATLDTLASLERKFKELLEKYSDSSPALRKEGDDLRASIVQRQVRIKDAVAEETAFRKLFEQTPDLPGYRSAFQGFLSRYPNHLAEHDLKVILANMDAVQDAYATIQVLCNEYNGGAGDIAKLQRAAPSIQRHCEELAQKINGPVEVLFAPVATVARFAETVNFDKETLDDVEKILMLVARKELYPYITPSGQWYYCTTPPDRGNLQPDYVTTFASTGKKIPQRITLKELESIEEFSKLKRQRGWAAETLKTVEKIKTDPGSKAHRICVILDELVSQEGLDPILRMVMLNLLIGSYGRTDPVFAEVFADLADKIKKSKIDMETNWLDVESSGTVLEREKCQALLEQLPDFKRLSEKIQADTAEFHRRLKDFSPQFQLLGILHKDGADWECKPKVPQDAPDGDLFALSVSEEKVTPSVIGRLRDGKVVITVGVSRLRYCLPVFLKH